MTVDANRDVFSIPNDPLADRAHKSREFIGESITHSVRHVENRRAFRNGRVEHFAQIVNVAARRVFGRKLDFFGQVPGHPHRSPGHLDYFGARLLQFVFEVDI